jgi:hypothetical protein
VQAVQRRSPVALPQLDVGGRQTREPQLAADLVLALDQRHLIARECGLEGGCGSRRSGADHQNTPAAPAAGGVLKS